MERVRRFAGLAKGAAAGPVRRDEDESLVLFGELYRHEQEKDVNLLEPMFSVEFEAIQGDGRMFKLPSGKRDYILPDGEKNDYDWLKTPPATPLFPSLEMEANDTSQMIFQKELPILQPVKTSRFWSKPDSISSSTSTRSESPASSSSKSVTPTARPSSSSSKKSLVAKGASKEQDSSYRIDKRSSYTPLTNRQHAAVPAARAAKPTATKPSKKTSGNNKVEGSDNTSAVKSVAKPDKQQAPKKHAAATAPKARSNDSAAAGVKNLKADAGTTRRLSRPPPATIGGNGEVRLEGVQDAVARKGKGGAGAGVVPATCKSAGTGSSEAVAKGRRRAGGEKEQRPKLGSHAKK